jgi:CheY-like chemotaxis protein
VAIQEVDVTALVEEMLDLLRLPLSGQVVLDRQLARDLPPVAADATQLRQVLMNLVSNAAEAIGAGPGTVVVRTRVVDGAAEGSRPADGGAWQGPPLGPIPYVAIEVGDDGAGMDEATRRRVFDPFFTTKVAGRGLGLATVLGFVRTHGGAIDIASRPGVGSWFRLYLPAARRRAVEDRSPAAPAPAPAPAGVVLVVDDDELVRGVVTEILEQERLEVIGAGDGPSALEIYARRRGEIGLVLIDLTMPRMSGDELFRQLRELDPAARVLFSSGYHEGRLAPLLADDRRVGFIRKPFRIDELLARVRAMMA